MVVEIIESRYTVVISILSDYLELKFGKNNFQIFEPDEDSGEEKWKVQVPRSLTPDEKREIQRKFVDEAKRKQDQRP